MTACRKQGRGEWTYAGHAMQAAYPASGENELSLHLVQEVLSSVSSGDDFPTGQLLHVSNTCPAGAVEYLPRAQELH